MQNIAPHKKEEKESSYYLLDVSQVYEILHIQNHVCLYTVHQGRRHYSDSVVEIKASERARICSSCHSS